MIAGQRIYFFFLPVSFKTLERALPASVSAGPLAPCSLKSPPTVWSCRIRIFHRVIRAKERGPGCSWSPGKQQRIFYLFIFLLQTHGGLPPPRRLTPTEQKQGKRLCEDYQPRIAADVAASAPFEVFMSIRKHIGSVYRLWKRELRGRSCIRRRPRGKLKR